MSLLVGCLSSARADAGRQEERPAAAQDAVRTTRGGRFLPTYRDSVLRRGRRGLNWPPRSNARASGPLVVTQRRQAFWHSLWSLVRSTVSSTHVRSLTQ